MLMMMVINVDDGYGDDDDDDDDDHEDDSDDDDGDDDDGDDDDDDDNDDDDDDDDGDDEDAGGADEDDGDEDDGDDDGDGDDDDDGDGEDDGKEEDDDDDDDGDGDADDDDDDDDGDVMMLMKMMKMIMMMMMMMMMLMLRRRKMMMLRRRKMMMLRRKTDPKTRKHTLRACAVEMQTDIAQEPFCLENYKTNGRGHLQGHRFVRARSRNAHGHVTRGMLCGNLQGNAGPVSRDTRFVRTCTWTCHNRNFVQKFTGKMPDASDTTSIEHRALTPTVRTPQCGHTVWGTFGFPKQKRPDPGPPLDCSVLSNPLESGWSLQPSHPYAEVSRLLQNRCSRLR